MTAASSTHYRAGECATLLGVTVRALRHYERLGLLHPRRTDAGYRVYTDRDLEAVRFVRVLKSVGLRLADIKPLIKAPRSRVAYALGAQLRALRDKRSALDQAIGTLTEVSQALQDNVPIDDAFWRQIMETFEPAQAKDLKRRYTHQVAGKVDRIKVNLDRVRQFAELCRQTEAVAGGDPTGPEAQKIAERWMQLGADPLGFDPQVSRRAQSMLADTFSQANDIKPFLGALQNPEVLDFINRAIAARRESS